MAAAKRRCAVVYAVLCVVPVILAQDYQIPDVTIQALKPRGVRISIPDAPGLTLFAFQGHINKQINSDDVGTISGEVMRSRDGEWKFEDSDVTLKVGDVINYYVHVIKSRQGYHKDNLSFAVRELIDSTKVAPGPAPQAPVATPQTPTGDCLATATTVLSGPVCANQIIFEDYFDTLDENLWTIEQYIPSDPEYLFVSYQRPENGPMVSVSDGILRIEPKLQQTLPGYNSEDFTLYDRLDLTSGCTQPICVKEDGIPPIASGRIRTSKFAFTYGVIEVRARLPQGDWLYPDILLEPLLNKYGAQNYASGILRIAGALGNIVLNEGRKDYGNKVLYGGPLMDFKCRKHLLATKTAQTAWGNDFHNYTLRWAPDRIILSVDGIEWGRVEPAASGLQARLPRDICHPPRTSLKTRMAPFDDFFRITLGMAVGGVSEFPDQTTTSNGRPKPWRNSQGKAMLNFYNDMGSWMPTWTQPALLIDHVIVRAL